MRTSNLLCIEAIQTNNYDFLNETTEQLLDRLAIEGIQSQVLRTHPNVKGFQCGQKSLTLADVNFVQKIIQEIEIASLSQKSNNELMYSKIYVKYLENICEQINNSPTNIDVEKA